MLGAKAHADDAFAVMPEVGARGLHQQMEGGKSRSLAGEEIEEVPLWRQGDELAARGQVGEVGKSNARSLRCNRCVP